MSRPLSLRKARNRHRSPGPRQHHAYQFDMSELASPNQISSQKLEWMLQLQARHFINEIRTWFAGDCRERQLVGVCWHHFREGAKKQTPFWHDFAKSSEFIEPKSKLTSLEIMTYLATEYSICEGCHSSYQAVLIEKRLFFNWESSSKSVTCGCVPSSPR